MLYLHAVEPPQRRFLSTLHHAIATAFGSRPPLRTPCPVSSLGGSLPSSAAPPHSPAAKRCMSGTEQPNLTSANTRYGRRPSRALTERWACAGWLRALRTLRTLLRTAATDLSAASFFISIPAPAIAMSCNSSRYWNLLRAPSDSRAAARVLELPAERPRPCRPGTGNNSGST
ncbi:hypothetical protein P154DRAFT_17177 [Amniculicola lignicola CBS 123094]|uniref:Uncharacterized protein n=1 Tax=Amniculicola lignicola CBS 123094 TaxID=1392246 RepID=A0A6A5X5C9_9PLEO|nr:hypothetical protein P154DRAFT_17177 [Amniculicola lignicola CBS 123094]